MARQEEERAGKEEEEKAGGGERKEERKRNSRGAFIPECGMLLLSPDLIHKQTADLLSKTLSAFVFTECVCAAVYCRQPLSHTHTHTHTHTTHTHT